MVRGPETAFEETGPAAGAFPRHFPQGDFRGPWWTASRSTTFVNPYGVRHDLSSYRRGIAVEQILHADLATRSSVAGSFEFDGSVYL